MTPAVHIIFKGVKDPDDDFPLFMTMSFLNDYLQEVIRPFSYPVPSDSVQRIEKGPMANFATPYSGAIWFRR